MGLQVPVVLQKPAYVTVWVQVKPAEGTGFTGTGVGWTLPTHTIPIGWHMGMAWVCAAQPVPIPIQVWVRHHTRNICGYDETPWVHENLCGLFFFSHFFIDLS